MKSIERATRKHNWKMLVGHPPAQAVTFDPEPETVCFRGQTLAIVRHFFEISSQLGRLPSILGRDFLCARVTSQVIPSFEDQAVFVHDIRRALAELQQSDLQIVTLIGIYDLTHDEAAAMLHCSSGWVSQCFAEAIDTLTQVFLDRKLLSRDQPDRRQAQLKATARPQLPRKKPCASVQPERIAVGVAPHTRYHQPQVI